MDVARGPSLAIAFALGAALAAHLLMPATHRADEAMAVPTSMSPTPTVPTIVAPRLDGPERGTTGGALDTLLLCLAVVAIAGVAIATGGRARSVVADLARGRVAVARATPDRGRGPPGSVVLLR